MVDAMIWEIETDIDTLTSVKQLVGICNSGESSAWCSFVTEKGKMRRRGGRERIYVDI